MFNDPLLNVLEEQVNISNQNIAAAEAQFRGARSAIGSSRAGLFPVLTAGLTGTVSRGAPNGPLAGTGIARGGSTSTFYSLPLGLTYEADVWGRVRRTVEAAT